MAMSISPNVSPSLGSAPHLHRGRSVSPPHNGSIAGPATTATTTPHHPMTKREKRLYMMAQLYEQKEQQFRDHKDAHYRQQLLAIQLTNTLVSEADLHGAQRLPDAADEIDALVLDAYNKTGLRSPLTEAPQRAAAVYARFAYEINAAMEQRDAELTVHRSSFETKMTALKADYQYARKLAKNEHAALAATTRDRLLNSLISRRNRLNKEKDGAELGDASAILLHPSQFNVMNPASPGMGAKRATRLRRDVEDHGSFDGKRKRRPGDRDDSPAPSRQRLENGTSTPIWHAERNQITQVQHLSSAYSIDKLFSERELAMTYNAAAMAAHAHMVRHSVEADSDSDSAADEKGSPDPDSKPMLDPDTNEIITNGTVRTTSASPPPSSAPAMDRQPSHATRSTRAGAAPNFVSGITNVELMTDLNYPGNMDALAMQTPRLPHPNASLMTKAYVRGEAANQPSGLQAEDAAAEMDVMRRAARYNEGVGQGANLGVENGGRELLEKVAQRWEGGRWLDRRGVGGASAGSREGGSGSGSTSVSGDEGEMGDGRGNGDARDDDASHEDGAANGITTTNGDTSRRPNHRANAGGGGGGIYEEAMSRVAAQASADRAGRALERDRSRQRGRDRGREREREREREASEAPSSVAAAAGTTTATSMSRQGTNDGGGPLRGRRNRRERAE